MTDSERSDSPHDRLTRICDAMVKSLESHPESTPVDKAIIMLDDGARGGLVLHGYDDDGDAMVDLFMHLRAIVEANGKQLLIAPLGGDG